MVKERVIMLRTFLIVKPGLDQKHFAKLTYDEETATYGLIIPKDAERQELPAIPYLLQKKGVYEANDQFARMFVKERVIPPERQNIGMIMRKIGIRRYREFDLLVYNEGRSCQDDFILKEVTEEMKQ